MHQGFLDWMILFNLNISLPNTQNNLYVKIYYNNCKFVSVKCQDLLLDLLAN